MKLISRRWYAVQDQPRHLSVVKIFSNVKQLPKALADNAFFIIADIYNAQAQYDTLVERFDRKRVVPLQSLHVRTAKSGKEAKDCRSG